MRERKFCGMMAPGVTKTRNVGNLMNGSLGYSNSAFQKFRELMARRGNNIAGFGWTASNVVQLVWGAATLSRREFAAAAVNLGGSLSHFFGARIQVSGICNFGTKLGCNFGIVGVVLTTYPSLINGEMGAYIGDTLFITTQTMGILSDALTERFSRSKNSTLRRLLGQPRLSSGILQAFGGRGPMLLENIVHRRWAMAVVFAGWALSDLAFSLSKPASKVQKDAPASFEAV